MARRPDLAFQDDTALMGPNQNALLDAIKRAGGKDVRTNLIYGRVKAEGFGAYDQLVNAARQRGLNVQATIMGTPGYATQWDQGLSAANADPRALQQFAGEVAGHFKGRIGRYSIWNEPNLNTFLVGAQGNAKAGGRRYRDLFRAGEAGVKGADRSAQVLFGELAPTGDVAEFLRYATAGKKPLRAAGLAFHAYETGKGPTWDISNLAPLQKTLASYARQGRIRTAQGKALPLYLTEMGYQRAEVPNSARAMARAYDYATKVGARQLLQYQIAPTVRKTVQDAPTPTDAYGGFAPGATHPATGWVWDTSLAPNALAQAISASRARASAAKAKRRR